MPTTVDYLKFGQLAEQRPPDWLIENVLPASSLVVLYSEPNLGKSFVALDWAMCVLTGKTWLFERAVKPGGVIYVAGEGSVGQGKRYLAWCYKWGDPAAEAADSGVMTRHAVDLYKDPRPLISLAKTAFKGREGPTLIVADTMARCMGDGNDSTSHDVSKFVHNCDRAAQQIGKDFGCDPPTVLILHHSNKPQLDQKVTLERGSGALRGAADAMFRLKKRQTKIELICEKMKEWELSETVTFQLEVVNLANGETSCVPVAPGDNKTLASESWAEALLVLRDKTGVFTTQEWRDLLPDMPKSSFGWTNAKLIELVFVEKVGRGKYKLTNQGLKWLNNQAAPANT